MVWEVLNRSRGLSGESANWWQLWGPGVMAQQGAGVMAADADACLQGARKKYRAAEALTKVAAGRKAAQGRLLLS